MLVNIHLALIKRICIGWSGAVAAALLVGCATTSNPDARATVTAPAAERREPSKVVEPIVQTAEAETPSILDRKIEPSDTLIVDVYGEKDFTARECRVQSSGAIILPLAGIVRVAGLTTAEASDLISKRLNRFIVEPQVSVDVKEYRLRTVSVMGQVEKAGLVKMPLEEKMDIIEAIAEAGGFSRTANKGKIDLTRKGKTATYSFEELKKEQDPRKKIWLQPGDVIYVHESFI